MKGQSREKKAEQRKKGRAEKKRQSREKKAVRLLFWYCLCAYWQLWQQLS